MLALRHSTCPTAREVLDVKRKRNNHQQSEVPREGWNVPIRERNSPNPLLLHQIVAVVVAWVDFRGPCSLTLVGPLENVHPASRPLTVGHEGTAQEVQHTTPVPGEGDKGMRQVARGEGKAPRHGWFFLDYHRRARRPSLKSLSHSPLVGSGGGPNTCQQSGPIGPTKRGTRDPVGLGVP